MLRWCANGCGQVIEGRVDKKYCSNGCRQKAHEKRVKKREEEEANRFTDGEQFIYDAIYRATDNGETMRLFGEALTKIPRRQWYDTLNAVWSVVVDACYAINNRETEEFPF